MTSASPPRVRPALPPGDGDLFRRVPVSLLLGSGILSVQIGAGIADRMFATVPAAGMTGLRLAFAAAMLAGFGARPAIRAVRGILADRAWRDAVVVAGFGLALATMNFSIYQAFYRIPLGIAVTIEFLGPLGVAVAMSRRLIDLVWVVFAGTGVALLGTAGVGASAGVLGHRPVGTELTGVAFGLAAAAAWACYILLSAQTGRRFSGGSGLVIAMVVAVTVAAPVAIASSGTLLLRPPVLAAGLTIGLLSSVIPYRFELETLRRVPARAFGIWMSIEPAVAALVGVIILSQVLSPPQWLAIGCVVIASAGVAFGSDRSAMSPQA